MKTTAKTISTDIFKEKYKALNKKQKEAVDTIYGPVMVVAGPGTGKTTVLTLRIANILLKTDTKPDEILALTFTDAATKNMREKLREIIGDASFRVNIFTFHGFANYVASLYPEYFEKIGGKLPSAAGDNIEIIEDILKRESFKELRPSTFGVKLADITKKISELKREAISPDDLSKILDKEEKASKIKDNVISEKVTKTDLAEEEKREKLERRLREFEKVYGQYEKELDKRGLYDFDDTILGLLDGVKKNKELLHELRESFQFILADEHQDANGAQNEILKLFKADHLDPPNLFIVGDDKQSIFRFQGAALENFYGFEKEFIGAVKIDLEENYRSQESILNATHHLISKDGRVHTKLSANTSHKVEHLEVLEYETTEDELHMTAKALKYELEKHQNDTIAVIARTNGVLYQLGKYLDVLGITYSLKGERSLFESFEYRKLFFLFSALVDPLEDAKFLKALYFGYFDIDVHDILKIEKYARRKREKVASVLLEGDIDEIDLKNKAVFLALRNELQELIKEAKKTALLEYLKKLGKKLFQSESGEAYEVLGVLFQEASKLVLKKRIATLDEYVAHLTLLEKHNLSPLLESMEKKSRLELCTIHKSKGLEYDHVYILDVTDKRYEKNKRNDLLPIANIGLSRDFEEDRRLFYVAITRAKQKVVISYSIQGGQGQSYAPSILIDDLDQSLLIKRKVEGIDKVDFLSTKSSVQEDFRKTLKQEFLERPFSVTALNNFLECPWKYFFRNLLQIPDVPEYSAMLGTACHEALRRFHLEIKKGHSLNEKDLKKIIMESVYKEAFSEGELPVALAKAEVNVLAYVKTFTPFEDVNKVYIEESVSFPLKIDTTKLSFEVLIKGKIDLAKEIGGKVEVIDFKTKKKVTRNEILGKTKNSNGGLIRQLQFYKYLWDKGMKDSIVEKETLTFLSPLGGDIYSESFMISEVEVKELGVVVEDTLVSIYSLDFFHNKCKQKDCVYCTLGEAFKRENKIA